MNYLLFYEQVEQVFESEMPSDADTSAMAVGEMQTLPPCFADIAERMAVWIEEKGYLKLGLTLKELSDILKTNRTYLSSYIKLVYQLSFREWISSLRLEYAKTMLKECPELTIAENCRKSQVFSRPAISYVCSKKKKSVRQPVGGRSKSVCCTQKMHWIKK